MGKRGLFDHICGKKASALSKGRTAGTGIFGNASGAKAFASQLLRLSLMSN
jgi:hypothetical protein